MASTTISNSKIELNFYSGGWSSYRATSAITSNSKPASSGGYANNSSKKTVLRFTIPSVEGSIKQNSTKLTFTIPYINSGNASSLKDGGTFYFLLTDTDPIPANKTMGTIPDAYDSTTSCDWEGNGAAGSTGSAVGSITFSISEDLSKDAGKTYYLVIGTNKAGNMQIGYASDPGRAFSIKFNYTAIGAGTATISVKDNNNNTCTISGTITGGTNNDTDLSSAYLLVTTDGTTPSASNKDLAWYDSYDTGSPKFSDIAVDKGGGDYSYSVTISASNFTSSTTVKARLYCAFLEDGSVTKDGSSTLTYRKLGSGGTLTINDDGDNTFSFSYTNYSNGTGNSIKSVTLYYTVGGGSEVSVALNTTASGSYTYSPPTAKITANTKITARTVTVWNYAVNGSGKNSATVNATAKTITFHTAIGNPSILVENLYNNKFKITATPPADAAGNEVKETKFYWGYDTNYANEFTTNPLTQSLTISGTANTRTVYAKAVATPTWTGDTAKHEATHSAAITQYIAPTTPGSISVEPSDRLTVKKPWTFTWGASTARNTNSPVLGYAIYFYKVDTATEKLETKYYLNVDKASYTLENPAEYFKPNETMEVAVRAFTKLGQNNTGSMLSSAYSRARFLVQNAGIVHVKQDGQWHEGQVWVKVAGVWKEAETVNVKVNGAWKESQ